jgi:hypothetical protein
MFEMLKWILKKVAYGLGLRRNPSHVEDSPFAYPWLNSVYCRLTTKNAPELRPNYTWAMIQAAHLASSLGVERISAVEFGVAGGNGLIAMERAAEKLEDVFKIGIDVYGFDSGQGLPKSQDYRDLPNLWAAGAYPMDEEKLRRRLNHAQLIVGLVQDTVPQFLASQPAPIGFVSFDLDLYSSTVEAFQVLEAGEDRLLPRIYCYFDDILGFTFGHHNGERLAINEFNAAHRDRQISQIYGLRFYLPRQAADASWAEKMYMTHILDHRLYGEPDGLVRDARMDLTTK